MSSLSSVQQVVLNVGYNIVSDNKYLRATLTDGIWLLEHTDESPTTATEFRYIFYLEAATQRTLHLTPATLVYIYFKLEDGTKYGLTSYNDAGTFLTGILEFTTVKSRWNRNHIWPHEKVPDQFKFEKDTSTKVYLVDKARFIWHAKEGTDIIGGYKVGLKGAGHGYDGDHHSYQFKLPS